MTRGLYHRHQMHPHPCPLPEYDSTELVEVREREYVTLSPCALPAYDSTELVEVRGREDRSRAQHPVYDLLGRG